MKSKYIYGLIITVIIILIITTIWGWLRYQRLETQLAEKQSVEKRLQDLESQLKNNTNNESSPENNNNSSENDNDEENDKLTVNYTTASYDSTTERLSFEGVLEPSTTHYVIPKVPGRAEKVNADVGDKVSKGDILLEIETDELDLKLKQAEAAVKAAENQLKMAEEGARSKEVDQLQEQIEQAEVNLDLVQSTYERTKKLYEEDVVSRQEYDEVKTKKEEVESQLSSALTELEKAREGAREEELEMSRADLEQAQAELEQVKLNLDDSTVEAQADGVIARREVEEGELVSDEEPSFILIDVDPIVVVLEASEKDMVQIDENDEAEITIDAYPDQEFYGKVSQISPMADSEKRIFEIEVEIENSDNKLKPGMYANLKLQSKSKTEKLVIPSSALREDDNEQDIVYVLEDEIVYTQEVKTGDRQGTMVEIESGLKKGDTVITNPSDKLNPGMKVEAREADL